MDNPQGNGAHNAARNEAQNAAHNSVGQNGATSSNGWNQPRSDTSAGQAHGQQAGRVPYAGHAPYAGQQPYAGQVPGNQGRTTGFGGQQVPGQHTQGQQTREVPAYAGQPYTGPQGAPNVQGAQGLQVPTAEEPKKKRSVGLGTALAMMLVGAVAAGGVTGAVVGAAANDNDSTATVNEVLQNQPVANSTGKEPADGSVEAVAAKVLPAVVSIYNLKPSGGAEGSGSVISPDGYVLTNHHVVAGADQGGHLEVTMNDGSRHTATFVASDATTDVAVIKIDDVKDLPYLQFGDSDAATVGQQVVAVGSPLGLNATVTSGIVSAKNRPVRASQEGGESSLIDAIQTDAAVNPGNSGGPLVDMDGNIVGMNSMIASLASSVSGEGGSIGLGFAIPSNFAKRMADELINNGEVKHPTLGVKVRAQSNVYGAQIVEVEPDSPADKAGLKSGDVVTRVNDRLIESSDSLIAATRSQEFGAKVTLEVKREDSDETRQVEVTLASE